MKIYQVTFDAVMLTVVINENQNLFSVLMNYNDHFSEEEDKLFYIWDASYKEECTILDITNKRGVIHAEAH